MYIIIIKQLCTSLSRKRKTSMPAGDWCTCLIIPVHLYVSELYLWNFMSIINLESCLLKFVKMYKYFIWFQTENTVVARGTRTSNIHPRKFIPLLRKIGFDYSKFANWNPKTCGWLHLLAKIFNSVAQPSLGKNSSYAKGETGPLLSSNH